MIANNKNKDIKSTEWFNHKDSRSIVEQKVAYYQKKILEKKNSFKPY